MSPEPRAHIGHGPILTVPGEEYDQRWPHTEIWPVLLKGSDSSEAEGPRSLIYFLNLTFSSLKYGQVISHTFSLGSSHFVDFLL